MGTESAVSDRVAGLVASVRASKLPSASVRRRVREEAGLSLRDVAGAVGVHWQTVLRWEEGVTPRRELAIRYRELLDALASAGEKA